jgi:hypothetical protein
MNKITILISILLISSLLSFSQNMTITIGQVKACKGDTIAIPLLVKGFANVCAVGVRFSFDTLNLKFIDCINIPKSLPGADYANVRNFVTLGWFSANQSIVGNIKDNDKLFEVKFVCIKPSSELKFETSGCMAADCNLKDFTMTLNPSKVIPDNKCK